jgi:hypothetical protein
MTARTRFTAAWLVVLVLSGCLWWGLHPPRTEHSYRQRSASTVALLRSNVETTRLWLAAIDAGRATSNATRVALTETETDANSALTGYSGYQPPDPTTADVRGRVIALGDQVVALLGEIRVDARAGRWEDALGTRDELDSLSRRLTDLQRRVAP